MKKKAKNRFLCLFLLIISGIIAAYQSIDQENAMSAKQENTSSPVIPPQQNSYLLQVTPRNLPEVILRRKGYTLSYNSNNKTANWVAWELTSEKLVENTERSNNFLPDPDLPAEEAVTTRDYKGSGWDRGHLCPAGDNKWSRQAMIESFYLTNICPQHHNLNRGDWNELEQKCRKWVKKYHCLHLVAGPIFYKRKPRTIGTNKVAVPDAFFKVILVLDPEPKAVGFIYKNNEGNHPLDTYINTVDEVERITGIDFFPVLPDEIEKTVEATYNLKDWK